MSWLLDEIFHSQILYSSSILNYQQQKRILRWLYNQNIWCTFVKTKKKKVPLVDYRMRDHFKPSVRKKPIRLNQWSKLFECKNVNIYLWGKTPLSVFFFFWGNTIKCLLIDWSVIINITRRKHLIYKKWFLKLILSFCAESGSRLTIICTCRQGRWSHTQVEGLRMKVTTLLEF